VRRGAAIGAALLLAACAAGKPVPQTGQVPPSSPEHEQIAELDRLIAADVAAQGGAAPSPQAVADAHTMSILDAAGVCVRPLGDTCGDVCTLSDSICANAGKICDLAARLPGDAWAEERCDAGKAACLEAAQRCCACD
jgi:hypothetical protein